MEGEGWQLEVTECLNMEGRMCEVLLEAERLGNSLPDSLDWGQWEGRQPSEKKSFLKG